VIASPLWTIATSWRATAYDATRPLGGQNYVVLHLLFFIDRGAKPA